MSPREGRRPQHRPTPLRSHAACHTTAGEWNNAQPPALKTCDAANQKYVTDKDAPQEMEEGQQVIFTYDMVYKVRWA